jgi:hypothetical protein
MMYLVDLDEQRSLQRLDVARLHARSWNKRYRSRAHLTAFLRLDKLGANMFNNLHNPLCDSLFTTNKAWSLQMEGLT